MPIFDLAARPFLRLHAEPGSYRLSSNMDELPVPLPRWPERIRLSATAGVQLGRASIVTPQSFSSLTRARFEVSQNFGDFGFPPVDQSGSTEERPARWVWGPRTAGFFQINAFSTANNGAVALGSLDYAVPINVTLAAEAATLGVRITATLHNAVRTIGIPGVDIRTSFLFAAKRTDIPTNTVVARDFADPAVRDAFWSPRLPAGIYKFYCAVFQQAGTAQFIAHGEQVLVGHHVMP